MVTDSRFVFWEKRRFIVPLWHSHVHAIVPEGVFTESGDFVHIPDIWRRFEVPGGGKHRAEEFWQERVFYLLLAEHKTNDEITGNMRSWKHSPSSAVALLRRVEGFSVDTA